MGCSIYIGMIVRCPKTFGYLVVLTWNLEFSLKSLILKLLVYFMHILVHISFTKEIKPDGDANEADYSNNSKLNKMFYSSYNKSAFY